MTNAGIINFKDDLDKQIYELYQKHTNREIAEKIGKNESFVQKRSSFMRLSRIDKDRRYVENKPLAPETRQRIEVIGNRTIHRLL